MEETEKLTIENKKANGKTQTFTFESKEDAIGHIIGLMESYGITKEDLSY